MLFSIRVKTCGWPTKKGRVPASARSSPYGLFVDYGRRFVSADEPGNEWLRRECRMVRPFYSLTTAEHSTPPLASIAKRFLLNTARSR